MLKPTSQTMCTNVAYIGLFLLVFNLRSFAPTIWNWSMPISPMSQKPKHEKKGENLHLVGKVGHNKVILILA